MECLLNIALPHCLYACNNCRTPEWTFAKFDIGEFYENLWALTIFVKMQK
jgi:hypothetical protein